MFYQHTINDYFSLGFKASLSGDFLFSEHKYTLMSNEINTFFSNINYLNFNIPLYLQFTVKKISIDLGVQPALFLFTYSKFKFEIDGEVHNVKKSIFFHNPYDLFDIGIYSAISYKYSKTWNFEISYHNGLLSGISDLSAYNYYVASYSVGIKYFFGQNIYE